MANITPSNPAINPILHGNNNFTTATAQEQRTTRRRKISVIRVHPLGMPSLSSSFDGNVPPTNFSIGSVIIEGCATAPVQTTAQAPTFPGVTSSSSAGTIPHAAQNMEKGVSGGSSSSNPLSPPSSSSTRLTNSKRLTSQSIADLPSKLSEIFKTGASSSGIRAKTLTSMKTLAKSCADLRQIDDARDDEEAANSIQASPKTTASNPPDKFMSPMNSPSIMSPSCTSTKFNFPNSKSGKDIEIMEKRIKQAMLKQQGALRGGINHVHTIHPQLPTYRASVLGSPPLTRSKTISEYYRTERNLPGRRSRADSSISDSEDEGFAAAYPYHKYSSKSAMSSPQRLSPTKLTRVTTPGLVDDPSKLLKTKLKHMHSFSVSNLPDSLMKEAAAASKSHKKGQSYHHFQHGNNYNTEFKEEAKGTTTKSKRPKDLVIPTSSSEPVPVPFASSNDQVYYTVHGGVNPMLPMSARSNLRRFEDCERIDCAGDAEFLDESYEDMLMEEGGNSFEEGFYYPHNSHFHQQQQHPNTSFYYPFSSGGSSYNNTRRSGSPSSGYKTMGPFHFPSNYSATIGSSSYNGDPVLVKYLKERERQKQQQQLSNSKHYSYAVRNKGIIKSTQNKKTHTTLLLHGGLMQVWGHCSTM